MAKRTTQTTTQSTPVATLVADAGAETATQPAAPVQAPETPEAVAAAAAAAEAAEEVARGVAEAAQELAPLLTAIGAKQAAEEERVAEVMEQADKALLACRKAYAKGDRAHCAGQLEAGRWASQYIALRLSVGAPRDNAVDAVQGELAKVAWDKVDANRLVAVYHTHRLLVDGYMAVTEAKSEPDVPYTHLRDAWRQLAQRVEGDKAEHWQLLPGQEQAAVAVFVQCVKDRVELPGVLAKVREVQAAYAAQEARRKQDREEELTRAAQAQEQQAQKARAEAMEQAKLKADAERALKAAQDKAKQDASEEAALAVQEAADRLAAEQRAMVEKQARAEQEQREKARLERERRELEQERQRAADKAAKQAAKAEREAKAKQAQEQGKDPNKANHPGVASTREQESRKRSASAQGKGVTDDPLAALAEGTAKDSAEQLVAVFECHQTPDDLLEELLKGLAHSADMSARARRACKEALLSMNRPAPQTPTPAASPSPVDLAAHLAPQVNGTPAHAGK